MLCRRVKSSQGSIRKAKMLIDLRRQGTLRGSMSEARRTLADRLYLHAGALAEQLAGEVRREPRDEQLIEDLAIAVGLLAEAAGEVKVITE